MLRTRSKPKKQIFHFPSLGYLGYGISKFFKASRPLSIILESLETMLSIKDLRKMSIEKPIYISGLARAGTTIVLEMLSKHDDVASHQYKHLIMPYFPYWTQRFSRVIKLYDTPVERVHRDGIMVTLNSPEAVEEIIWRRFFKSIQDENSTDVIGRDFSNPKFEQFYIRHIKKLLLSQNCSRYLAKNNYNISRLEYLLKLFPNSKFLIIIRNPINHIASLIKQTDLFAGIENQIPIVTKWMKLLGHQEFSRYKSCINVDNRELVHEIRKLWSDKDTRVKGWARYWASLYDFIANQLETSDKVKKATLIVKYDDLCENPGCSIDKILKHVELPAENFKPVKEYYIKHLQKPTYYSPNFSQHELRSISEVTEVTANRLGL